MTMANGWIKLNKTILDSKIWNKKEPYDCRSAYIDLMLEANFKESDILTNHGLIHVNRGQAFVSVLNLSKKWQWSRNKVYRFLRTLCDTQLVTLDGTPDGTLITLLEYDVSEFCDTTDGTTNDTSDGTSDGTPLGTTDGTHHKNKRNKENKNNTIVDSVDPAEELFERLWKLYPRKEGKSSVSKEAKKEIYKIGYDRMAKAIDRYARQVAGRDMKYVKMGSSFFNTNYVDYLEEEKPTSAVVPMEQIPRIYPRKYRD